MTYLRPHVWGAVFNFQCSKLKKDVFILIVKNKRDAFYLPHSSDRTSIMGTSQDVVE
jgi:hypothetical protein